MSDQSFGKLPLRIAVQVQPQRCSYEDIQRTVLTLEEIGVDMIMNWDHFFPQYGPADDRHYECWTTLGAWAASTSKVEIGPLVSCTAYRNPDLLADMARTVDHISGGRLVLGVGAGWSEQDFTEYGYAFGTPGERLDGLATALARIEKRMTRLNPLPKRRIPILIGGNGERRTLPLAARYADIWHGFGHPAALLEKHRILDGWCEEVGRDPGEIERSARVRKSPDELGADLAEIGTRLINLVVQGPEFDLGHVRDWVAFRDDFNRPNRPTISE
jgi:probable F420-dependent oxidoreductase